MNALYLGPLVLLSACIPRLYPSVATVDPGTWVAPENSWPQAEPPSDLVGGGYEPGQVVPDFRLVDQFGDEVAFWQFYGNLVLLDISTIWCAPCQAIAEGTEETWQDYRDEGFVYVTLLQEDLDGDPPDAADLQVWVDNFGLTSPVLADGEKLAYGAIRNGAWPAVLLVGRNMAVLERIDPATDDSIRAAIESAL